MHPGLLLYIVTMSAVYLLTAVWLVHVIRNPRAAWERMNGPHTHGGEPLPGVLEKIQRQSVIGLVLMPIIFVVGGFMANLKFQELERKWRFEKQRQQSEAVMPRQQRRLQQGAAATKEIDSDAKQAAGVE